MKVHTLDWLLEHLEGVEGGNGQYTAWCPVHNDLGTSRKGLSITVTASGKILCKCHSCGATLPDVIRALEGENTYSQNGAGDFHPRVHKTRNGRREEVPDTEVNTDGLAWWAGYTGVPESTWEELGVLSHKGGVVFTFAGMDIAKHRRPPKEFSWAGKGERPPLWPVPEDELPEEIAICEGESDTGTMRHLGYHAFGITAGGGRGDNKYLSERHFKALIARGARKVLICGDADPAGGEMMGALADTAAEAGFEVEVLRLDEVLDPFSGISDVTEMRREAEEEEFGGLLQRAKQPISADLADHYADACEETDLELDWLIPGLVSPADKILISGPQKSYKTWLALELMRSTATGQPFLKREVEWTPTRTAAKVMFVQEEGSRQMWVRRLKRLQMPKDTEMIFWHRRGFKFTEPEMVAKLVDTCRREGVEMLFLDPLQRMIPGVEENDAAAMGIVWDGVQKLQTVCPSLVVVVLHHANKSEYHLSWESVRGSSRHAGEVDLGLFVRKHPDEDNTVEIAVDGRDIPQYMGTGDSINAHVRISTEEEHERGEWYFEMDGTEIKVNVPIGAARGKRNKGAVLQAILDGAETVPEIVEITGIGDNTVRKHLTMLISEDSVVEEDHGKGMAKIYLPKEDDEGQPEPD